MINTYMLHGRKIMKHENYAVFVVIILPNVHVTSSLKCEFTSGSLEKENSCSYFTPRIFSF